MDARPVPDAEDEPRPETEPADQSPSAAAADPPTAGADPAAVVDAQPGNRPPSDHLALAMLAAILVLLLVCAALAFVAWRHAPVNPAIPAALWLPL